LSNFSKKFNHWLAVCGNEAQRVCVWKVAGLRARIFRRKIRRSKLATAFG